MGARNNISARRPWRVIILHICPGGAPSLMAELPLFFFSLNELFQPASWLRDTGRAVWHVFYGGRLWVKVFTDEERFVDRVHRGKERGGFVICNNDSSPKFNCGADAKKKKFRTSLNFSFARLAKECCTFRNFCPSDEAV